MMADLFKDKTILITGAAGTVGKELVRQLLEFSPGELRLLDNNESEMFFMQEEYQPKKNVVSYVGSIRDSSKVDDVSRGADILFHLAAFKHVSLCEYNPYDAVMTNVVGTQNVLKASLKNGVGRMLFTSSDKAVNPTNVMGSTKLLAERMVTAYNANLRDEKGIFASSRFGNVIGSRGSVVPLFHQQIKRGGPVTVTHREMTRFVMTIAQSARLVLEACTLAKGGEVFISKMPVIRIIDLAEVMIEILAPRFGYAPEKIRIEWIGVKAGEKMYEELLSTEERLRSRELTNHFVTLPAFRFMFGSVEYSYSDEVTGSVQKPYISSHEPPLSKDELRDLLLNNTVLEQMEG